MADRLFSEFDPKTTEEWLEIIRADLKGKPLEKLGWTTPEGFSLFPAIGPEASPPSALKPAVRKSSGKWKVHHRFASGTVDEVLAYLATENHFELDSVGIVLDPTGQRLNGGVYCPTLGDLRKLMKGLEATGLEVHWEAGGHAFLLAGWLGTEWNGSLGFDPLAYLLPPFEVAGKEIAKGEKLAALFHAFQGASHSILRVDMTRALAAGANQAEQLAWALSLWVDQVEALKVQGIAPKVTLSKTHFAFGVGTDFYAEIAKLRAFRQLMDLVLEPYGLAGTPVNIVGIGADAILSRLDPHTNMLRTTTAAMAAVLGGCDWVALPPFDRAYQPADALSVRMARNIQLILRDESGLDQVADPGAGAWFIEDYTRNLADAAWNEFLKLETQGGFLTTWDNGGIKNAAQVQHARINIELGSRKKIMVGVNQYPGAIEPEMAPPHAQHWRGLYQKEIPNPDWADEASMVHQYLDHHAKLTQSLKDIGKLPLSEQVNALPTGWSDQLLIYPFSFAMQGSYLPFEGNWNLRQAEGFEQMREQLKGAAKVALFPFGDLKMRMARMGFARDLIGVLGLTILEPAPSEDFEKTMAELQAQSPDYWVFCAANEDYDGSRWPWMANIRAQFAGKKVILAGKPENAEALAEAGIAHFIAAGMDVPAFAQTLLHEINQTRA